MSRGTPYPGGMEIRNPSDRTAVQQGYSGPLRVSAAFADIELGMTVQVDNTVVGGHVKPLLDTELGRYVGICIGTRFSGLDDYGHAPRAGELALIALATCEVKVKVAGVLGFGNSIQPGPTPGTVIAWVSGQSLIGQTIEATTATSDLVNALMFPLQRDVT